MVAFAAAGAALVVLGALVATPGVNAQVKDIVRCLVAFLTAPTTGLYRLVQVC